MAAAERTGWFRPKRDLNPDNDKQMEDVEVPAVEAMRIDGEIFAMQACYEQIAPVDVAGRARIFSYLYARLGPPVPEKTS